MYRRPCSSCLTCPFRFQHAQLGANGGVARRAGNVGHDFRGRRPAEPVQDVHDLAFALGEQLGRWRLTCDFYNTSATFVTRQPPGVKGGFPAPARMCYRPPMRRSAVSRRTFLSLAAALPFAASAALKAARNVPVGLELYSVRGDLAKDLLGTVAAVGKMGYQVVEFYAPYLDWTPDDGEGRAQGARRHGPASATRRTTTARRSRPTA